MKGIFIGIIFGFFLLSIAFNYVANNFSPDQIAKNVYYAKEQIYMYR